jgi:NAD(P) transhydrogenase
MVLKKKYDVAVIGSGPAGTRAAVQCAKKGKKVIVIDRREYKPGGVSLHTGTIPSKTLREAVLYLKGMRRRKVYGQSRRFNENITLEDLLERVEVILSHELKIIKSQLNKNGIDVMYGQASFADPHTLEVDNRWGEIQGVITADIIFICTGTIPRHPADVPFDYKTILDSNFVFSQKSRVEKLPESLIVYGAGVIGSEYASMFAALGSKVWLMDNHKSLFPFVDRKIVAVLREHMERLGMNILLGQDYKEISVTADGKGRIETQDGTIVEADAVLFSKGRLPCVDPLKPDYAGVELTDRKLVKVDETYRTSVKHIFACGDVIGFPALASTSAEQGRLAARFALDEDAESRPELLPLAIYTIPEISLIGKTEQELTEQKIPYEKGLAYYYEISKAAIAGDDTGLIKILFHPETRKLLGIHIIGDQAAELLHIGQMVMAFDGQIDSFIKNVFNYPTWAEGYKIAALNGVNRLKTNGTVHAS